MHLCKMAFLILFERLYLSIQLWTTFMCQICIRAQIRKSSLHFPVIPKGRKTKQTKFLVVEPLRGWTPLNHLETKKLFFIEEK